MFSESQRKALNRADKYLVEMVSDDVRVWLKTYSPKNISDAHEVVELVFALAYRKGDINELYGHKLIERQEQIKQELERIRDEYAN